LTALRGGGGRTTPPLALTRRFEVLIALKPLASSKTRLELPVGARMTLAFAMAADTMCAAASSELVSAVHLVCSDPEVRRRATHLPVHVLTAEPAGGLNAALTYGASAIRERCDLPLALLTADLPAASGEQVTAALATVGRNNRVLSDLDGTGTVLLAVAAGMPVHPQFGSDSLKAHVATGAVAINNPGLKGLRRDVDLLGDLVAARRRLGVGPFTRQALEQIPWRVANDA